MTRKSRPAHRVRCIGLTLLLGISVNSIAQETDYTTPCAPVPVYRFTNINTSSHVLTISLVQQEFLRRYRPDYRLDGIAYYAYGAKAINTLPVYKIYNPATNTHLMTTSESERSALMKAYPSAVDEAVDHWVPAGQGGGAVQISRFDRPGTGSTLFTVNASELQSMRASLQTAWSGFQEKGEVHYVFPASTQGQGLPESRCEPIPVYRYYGHQIKESVLITSMAEKKFLDLYRPDYTDQGLAFYAHGPGSTAVPKVHRLFNPSQLTHFYTSSDAERTAYIAANPAVYGEGTEFAVEPPTKALAQDIVRIFRLKHPTTHRHMYALSETERDNWVKQHGVKEEGTPMAVLKTNKPSTTNGNKAPVVTLAAPAFVTVSPASLKMTATATDSDGTIAKVEYFSGALKLGETLAAPHEYTWLGVMPGNYTVLAVATDDKGARGTSTSVPVVVASSGEQFSTVQKDAARLLTQATFGIKSRAEIDSVASRGTTAWLNEQFALDFNSHVAYVDAAKVRDTKAKEEHAYEAIWQQWLNENGQLRARTAFALSQIFVISNIAPDLDTYAMASYMDLLNRNAFGNYRTLLGEVALHPAMGYYLNMQGSKKEDPVKGTHPNENFAREVLQLFSIGLYRLNSDGSRVIGSDGKPISTYDESVVKGFARAFSGWNFAGNNTSDPKIFDPAKENWLEPMQAWEMMHEPGTKTLLNGVTLPAGQTARKDLNDALDNIFNHPNVGPFIGRQLIQRFVTSNPSPAYIGRVAAAFNNNGSGTRGDLRAVLTAVLTDPEARDVAAGNSPSWGKQREPVIRFANFLRGLNATSPTGRNKIWYLDDADEGLGQSPLLAPSVFNFFSPNYRQPGPLAAANLVAPEFQITTETSMVGQLNFFAKLVKNASYGSGDTKLTMNLDALNTLAADPVKLVDALNLQFMNGLMTANTRSVMLNKLAAMPASKPVDRTKAALTLLSLSPEFAIQK